MKMNKKHLSVRLRVIISSLIPTITSFILLSAVLFYFLFNSLQETAKSELSVIGNRYASSFEKKLNDATDYLMIVSSLLEYGIEANVFTRVEMQELVFKIFDDYDSLDGSSVYFEPNMFDGKDATFIDTDYGTTRSGRICYYFFNDDGITAYMREALSDDIEFHLPHYYQAKIVNKPIYTNPESFEIDGRHIPMFTLTFPVRNSDGLFIGAVTVDLFLADLYESIQNEFIYEDGYIIISNERHQIISSPNFEDVGKSRVELGLFYDFPTREEGISHIRVNSILDGRTALVSVHSIYIPHLESNFYVSVAAPLAVIYSGGIRLIILIFIFSLVVFASIMVLMNYSINQATRPLAEIVKMVDKIAAGDYHSRISGDFKSEFAKIKDSINIMAENIETNVNETKAAQNIMQSILNGIDAYIYVTVPDTGEILFINEHMREHFGMEGDLIGQFCYKVLQEGFEERCDFCPCHKLDQNPNMKIIWEEHNTITKRDYRNHDCYIDWIDGRKVHLQHSVDITDLKVAMEDKIEAEKAALEFKMEKDKAEETSKVKSEFLANMSHEIRTPMNAIMGMSELLLSEKLTERQQNYVMDINHSSHSLLGIINDILDFSKIEAGKLELNPVDYDFHAFLDNFSSMFQFLAEKNNLAFRFERDENLPRFLYGDDIRLKQILTNICSNAIKFTAEGYVRLKISLVDENIGFVIEDTGMGIKEEELPTLFKAFVQADTHKNRGIKGTGLGLVICKSFVEMMNGTITISSKYGEGTTFAIVLPAVLGDEEKVLEAASHINSDFGAESAKVLIVDDNEINLKVASGLLRLHSINADTVTSGREALEMVQKNDYDIVFMDHMMPDMDGIETTEVIRNMGGKYLKLPIIALTANAIRGAKEMFLLHEFNDFLSKPIDSEKLGIILREYLPSEKIVEKDKEDRSCEIQTSFLDSVSNIESLNVTVGLNNCSGLEDMYRETLEMLYLNLHDNYVKLGGFLKVNDLKNFTILVHSIKSSLATVGAMRLALLAEKLEEASKGDDLAFCEKNGVKFLAELMVFSDELKTLFPDIVKEGLEREVGDSDKLREGLVVILEALENFDADTAVTGLAKLLGFDFGVEINENLEVARKAIAEFDFDKAIEVCDTVVGGVG